MIMSVWDDEYGISVHAKHQTTKENISEILKGFQKEDHTNGYEIFTVKGWDYTILIETYKKAAAIAREKHIPVLIHVIELTQPQGHSTSGSHERYKNSERLAWEQEFDCLAQMKKWMVSSEIMTLEDFEILEKETKKNVLEGKKTAWNAYLNPIKEEVNSLVEILNAVASNSPKKEFVDQIVTELKSIKEPIRKEIAIAARKAIRLLKDDSQKSTLSHWIQDYQQKIQSNFSSHLFSESTQKATNVKAIAPTYDANADEVDARIIIRDNFDYQFNKNKNMLIFGEDAGHIGDVNQGLEGMQEKYGSFRVADTGIREATILGQGIGMAMRGLRPIAEIQYLDYLLYAIQIMSDDLATLQYRTKGRQKAPLIIRTRGHRLEGIWHSGSPMGMIINAIRGIHVLVPRNMTKAAGFYNTLLESDEPALVIECLNGYRLKEKLPTNMGQFRNPIGKVEIIREGTDITIVSYGSTLRIIEQAAKELFEIGIQCEIIDVQSLLPFDITHEIVQSIHKTNRLLVIDEDVPGGASAYMMQEILENQNAYQYLDSKPQTLTAKAHRPSYGTDGDYYSKPAAEDVYEKVYEIMSEAKPNEYTKLY
jgi:pyruvate/2-oxoglutarate/acetoin dehydrogenase E1 component